MGITKEQLRWQCRRGMLELDLLLGNFIEKSFDTLTVIVQAQFVRLLQESDQNLYDWLIRHEDPREKWGEMDEGMLALINDIRK